MVAQLFIRFKYKINWLRAVRCYENFPRSTEWNIVVAFEHNGRRFFQDGN